MTRLIIIRHGRTAWNATKEGGQRFRGTVDLPLADEGIHQAQVTAQRLAGLPLAAVYSSPLQRAMRTAQILAAPHDLAVRALPGLSSMNYGQWAGLFRTKVARRWPELYRRWRDDPYHVQIPGGDDPLALRERAIAAAHQVLAEHPGDETILLVSHQVITKTLVCSLMGLPDRAFWQVRQDLCNLSTLDRDPQGGQFRLVSLNDTCHLQQNLPRGRGDGLRRNLRLILVRHGQTAWNVGAGPERFRGRADLPLDATGVDQARAVGRRLAGEPVVALYTSPLLRTQQTIAPLAEALGLPIQAHEGLLDIDYGLVQGLTHAQVASDYADLYRVWRQNPGQAHFPRGESLASVQGRLLALFQELADSHPGQTVVLVGHQIVNKVLICTLLGLDLDQIWRIGQEPAAINVFQRQENGWQILTLNDTCHLTASA